MQKARGQQRCSALLGFGVLAGAVALGAWLLLRGRCCVLHHLLAWNTKPAGHARLLDVPMTTQCDIFLSCVSLFLLIHGLSSNALLSLSLSSLSVSFPPSRGSLSSLEGVPLVLNSEEEMITKEV